MASQPTSGTSRPTAPALARSPRGHPTARPLASAPGRWLLGAGLMVLMVIPPLDATEPRKVRIGLEHNSPPLSFVTAGGTPAGFSAELLPAVGREAGLVFEPVVNSWSFLLAEFQAGRLDALASVVATAERRATMEFSIAHSSLHAVAYTRPQSAPIRHTGQFKGLKMATLNGTISHAHAVQHGYWGAIPIQFESWRDLLLAVKSGDCDFALNTRRLQFEQPDELGLARGFVDDIVHPFHIAVHRGDARLLEAINAGLAAVQHNGTADGLYAKWIGPVEPHPIRFRDLRPYLGVIAAAGVLLAAFVIWQQRIRRRLNAQATALRESEQRYRTLVEWSPEPLAIHRAGVVLYVNPAAVSLFGATSADTLVGRPALDLVHPESRAAAAERLATVSESGHAAPLTQHRFLRHDGTALAVEVQSLTFNYDGQPAIYTSIRDITERKRAELALRQQADNYRALIDHLQAGIVVHAADTSIVMSNPMAVRLLGLSEDQMRGKTAIDPVWSFINEDESVVPLSAYPVNCVIASGEPLTNRVIGVRRPDRPDPVWLLVSAYPDRNEHGLTGQVVVTFIDLTARKLAEERLRLGDHVLRSISQGVFVARPGGTIIATNAAFTAITGYSEADMHGQTISRLQGPETDGATAARLEQAMANATEFSGELLSYRQDGTQFWNELTLAPAHDAQGRLTHCIGVIRDHTARRRIEREKNEVEHQLRQSQKLEAIGQLSGGVAHDFNNLLTAILGNTALLMDDAQAHPGRQDLLEQVSLAANRAASLTRQLLLFSRQEELVRQELDLNQAIGELVKMLRRILGETIELQLACAPAPQLVNADPGMVSQIILNLAVNARDAMPQGGKLSISTTAIRFDGIQPVWTGVERRLAERRPGPGRRQTDLKQTPDALAKAKHRSGLFTCLSVVDQGTGMTPEVMEHIFEPFFTTKEVGRGTGLGLATVYGIVQEHDGWIEVESHPGVGTTFRIYLPRVSANALPPPAPAQPIPTAQAAGGGELVLVVEDEPAVSTLLQMVLERAGYEVRAFVSGAEALAAWPECQAQSRLLITDLVMPGGVSGVDLVRRARADRPDLRVIAMGGYSATLLNDRNDLGPDVAFIAKPFEIGHVLATVRAQITAPVAV